MTDEKQIECDGFLVESPYDYYVICGLNADEAWAQLVKAEYKNLSDMNDISGYIEALKRQGYTVRPVCFVSPEEKELIANIDEWEPSGLVSDKVTDGKI